MLRGLFVAPRISSQGQTVESWDLANDKKTYQRLNDIMEREGEYEITEAKDRIGSLCVATEKGLFKPSEEVYIADDLQLYETFATELDFVWVPDRDIRSHESLLKLLGAKFISEAASIDYEIGEAIGPLSYASLLQRQYVYLCSIAKQYDPDLDLPSCAEKLKSLKFIVVKSLACRFRAADHSKRLEKEVVYDSKDNIIYVHQDQVGNLVQIAVALSNLFGKNASNIRSSFILIMQH